MFRVVTTKISCFFQHCFPKSSHEKFHPFQLLNERVVPIHRIRLSESDPEKIFGKLKFLTQDYLVLYMEQEDS